MAKKTYLPTLIALLVRLCQYIIRYRNTLVAFMDDFGITNGSAKLDALVAACEAITEEYNNPPNP